MPVDQGSVAALTVLVKAEVDAFRPQVRQAAFDQLADVKDANGEPPDLCRQYVFRFNRFFFL